MFKGPKYAIHAGVQDHDHRDGPLVGEAALAPRFFVRHPNQVCPLRPRERGRHRDLRGITDPRRHGLRPVYDAPATDAHQKVRVFGLLCRPLDGAAGRVLAHAVVGAGVFPPEQALHPAHEVGLLVQRAPGDDEGPVV